MALSASAMGKIRLAAAAGKSIPAGWATDSNGRPTTDPAEAIKGMLLPAAGPKGFGSPLLLIFSAAGFRTAPLARRCTLSTAMPLWPMTAPTSFSPFTRDISTDLTDILDQRNGDYCIA